MEKGVFRMECVEGACEDSDCSDCAQLNSYGSSLENISCEYFSEGSFEESSSEECGSSDVWSLGPEYSEEDHGVCCAPLWPEDEIK